MQRLTLLQIERLRPVRGLLAIEDALLLSEVYFCTAGV